ncbi:restriction endonuclease [Lacticaseibacillus zeae]|nr:restriction endonuclease [Lacticaseibacillus zeae]
MTKLGRNLVEEYGVKLTSKKVHEQPLYQTHEKELAQRSREDGFSNAQDLGTIDIDELDQIRGQIIAYNNRIATELIERIRESEPVFFEHLVADLLTKMGYQGQNGSTIVTPQSNDGGIDAIINQDPLGTSTVYLQAKRYQASNIVQRPAIDTFYGALSRVHADRGVFITTSSFSKSAQETAKGFSIVLIDGIRLSGLMLKYHVGVQVRYHDELLKLDEDYFE